MIDKKCPECGALLKKKDIKNDKCWRCKKENIAEYFNTQEEKGEDKSLSSGPKPISPPNQTPHEQEGEYIVSNFPSDQEQPDVEIDETKYQELLQSFELNQNIHMGIVGGIGAAIIGAILWAIVTVVTEYQIGFMAIGVGFLVGYTVRILGKGVNITFGIIGAVCSFIGCLLGNVLSTCIFISQVESIPILDILYSLNISITMGLLIETFDFMDLLFYGIAIYEGYRFSFRDMTEKELASIIKPDGNNTD